MSSITPVDLLSAYSRAGTVKPASSGFSGVLSEALSTNSESMDDIFRRAAETYDVPVNLLLAIGKTESGFNANAVSPAGAQGVMQLMPGTARGLGVTDPLNAEQNIMGGAKYISQMLSAYDGDISLALAGYNAGMGNVQKYGGVPPFKETQNYIQKVTGYMGDAGLSAPSGLISGTGTVDVSALASTTQISDSADLSSLDFESLVQRWTTEQNMNMTALLLGTDTGDDEEQGIFSTNLSSI